MVAIPHPLGRRVPAPRLARPAGGWLFGALVVLGIGAMLPVLQSSAATTRGFTAQEAQLREATLTGEIRQIEADVARLTSASRIERRAAEIGLGPGIAPRYVSVAEPGPAPAKLPADYLIIPPSPEDGAQSWWRSLLSRLPLP